MRSAELPRCRADGWTADVRLEETRDLAYLDATLRRPEIWEQARVDGVRDPACYSLARYVADPRCIFLRVWHAGRDGGFIAFVPRGWRTYRMHVTLTPDCRGRAAAVAVRDACDWVFSRRSADCLLGQVCECNRPAATLVRWCGGRRWYLQGDQVRRHGRAYGVWMYRLNRRDRGKL